MLQKTCKHPCLQHFFRVWESCALVISTTSLSCLNYRAGESACFSFCISHQCFGGCRSPDTSSVSSCVCPGEQSRATLDHHVDQWVLNFWLCVGVTFHLIQSAFRHVKGGFSISTKSYTVERQIMLWAEREAERHANKKRADASISGDQDSSAVGKQIRAEL